jgi:hypothetical protein
VSEVDIITTDGYLSEDSNDTPYLRKLSMLPQISTAENITVPIGNGVTLECYAYGKNGEIEADGTLTINGKFMLRPYDHQILVAIFSLMTQKGFFEELDPESVTDENLKKEVDKYRVMSFYLNDVLEILGKTKDTNNRNAIHKSLSEHYAELRIGKNLKYIDSNEPHPDSVTTAIIATVEYESQKDKTSKCSIVLGDPLVREIVRGKFIYINLEVYLKFPQGRCRKLYVFLKGLFNQGDYFKIKLDTLLYTELSFEKPEETSKNPYRNKSELKKYLLLMEHTVLEGGFSAKHKKHRSYDIFENSGNEVYVILKKCKNPIYTPKVSNLKRMGTLQKLKDTGVSQNVYTFYMKVCDGEADAQLVEKNRILSRHPNGGLYVEFKDKSLKPQHFELSWDILEDQISFMELFLEYDPATKSFVQHDGGTNKAGLIRAIVEAGKYFGAGAHKKLVDLDAAVKKKGGKGISNNEPTEEELRERELKRKEAEQLREQVQKAKEEAMGELALKQKEAKIKFPKIAARYMPDNDTYSLLRQETNRTEPKAALRKVWLDKLSILIDGDNVILVAPSSMTAEWVTKNYLSTLTTRYTNVMPELSQLLCMDEVSFVDKYETTDGPKLPKCYNKCKSIKFFSVVAQALAEDRGDPLTEEEVQDLTRFIKDPNSPNWERSSAIMVKCYQWYMEE